MRQLISALEHAAITCRSENIEVSDLPDYVFEDGGLATNELKAEKDIIQDALLMFKGNRTLAAKHIGMSRVTLWKRIKDYNIKV